MIDDILCRPYMKTGIPSLNIPKTDPMDIDKYAHLPFDKRDHDPDFTMTNNINVIIHNKYCERNKSSSEGNSFQNCLPAEEPPWCCHSPVHREHG